MSFFWMRWGTWEGLHQLPYTGIPVESLNGLSPRIAEDAHLQTPAFLSILHWWNARPLNWRECHSITSPCLKISPISILYCPSGISWRIVVKTNTEWVTCIKNDSVCPNLSLIFTSKSYIKHASLDLSSVHWLNCFHFRENSGWVSILANTANPLLLNLFLFEFWIIIAHQL